MPYTSEHLLCVIGGNVTSGGSLDQWQFGLRVPIAPTFLQGDIPMETFLNDLEADARAWWLAISPAYAASTSLARVKANVIGQDGLYKNKAKTYAKEFAPVAGTAPQPALPSEVAWCITLVTAVARGLANKGRIYLPAPSSGALGPDGRVELSGYGTPVRNATRDLVVNVGNAPGVDGAEGIGDVSVMSKVRLGATNKVTGLRTDDVWDTQRRRGNSFVGIKSAISAVP